MDGRAGERAPGVTVAQRVNVVAQQGANEGVVEFGELALEGGEQEVDFGPDNFFAEEGGVEALEVFGLFLALALLPLGGFAFVAGGVGGDGFGHRARAEFAHEVVGVLDFFGVGFLVLGVGSRRFVAPIGPRWSEVAAVVGVPAEDVPEFRPADCGQGFAIASGGEDFGGALPSEAVAIALQLAGGGGLFEIGFERVEESRGGRVGDALQMVSEKPCEQFDAFAGGTGVPALLAVLAAFAGQAVVGAEGDDTAAQNFGLGSVGLRWLAQHGPA
ncbi:MAG TPA: hypothetical protein VNO52_09805, partial [Methylomirabilota bacterium]|nr:hypothetical protein [Methylomirabilota bacterium]